MYVIRFRHRRIFKLDRILERVLKTNENVFAPFDIWYLNWCRSQRPPVIGLSLQQASSVVNICGLPREYSCPTPNSDMDDIPQADVHRARRS